MATLRSTARSCTLTVTVPVQSTPGVQAVPASFGGFQGLVNMANIQAQFRIEKQGAFRVCFRAARDS